MLIRVFTKCHISCQYMKSGQSACTFRISQGFPWCQDGRYIAESTTGDQGTGKDDITNFLGTLIYPTLLEIYGIMITATTSDRLNCEAIAALLLKLQTTKSCVSTLSYQLIAYSEHLCCQILWISPVYNSLY